MSGDEQVAGRREVRPGWGLERERKWVGPAELAQAAAEVMGAWAAADGEHPEGELESVYFETRGLESWREKADGDALKRKVRVRWYREGGMSGRVRAWLELKDRVGAAREKARHAFWADASFLDAAPLEDGGWTDLLNRAAEEAGWGWAAGPVAAAVSIRYRRKRWRCAATGARLSADSGIRCTRANGRLLPFAGPMECPWAVCEAKSAGTPAWGWAAALARLGFRSASFSKFGHFMERIVAGGCR